MRRTWLVALAASALVGGMAAAQAGSSLIQQTASVSQGASKSTASDLSAAKRKKHVKRVRRSGRTSTGTPPGRSDSPTVNTGTKTGQEKAGVNKN